MGSFQMLSDGELKEFKNLSENLVTFSYDDYLNPNLRGFLRKKDAKGALGVSIGWKRCYFELLQGRLVYYLEQPDKTKMIRPDGIISMRYCQAIEAVGTKGFNITLSDRIYELEADETSTRNTWMQALQTCQAIIQKIEGHPSQSKNKEHEEIKQGPMDVKKMFGWKEFYLVSRDGMLFILYSKNGPRHLKIPLCDATFTPILVSNQERFGFSIDSASVGGTVQISCKDELNTQKWLTTLLKQKLVIEEALAEINS